MRTVAAWALVCTGAVIVTLAAQDRRPPDYKGTTFADARIAGGPQAIPGRVRCARYDTGGEGVAYHDTDAKNSGSGNLNVLRYGRVLKARGLVGVRGAGVAYDGLYYVSSVTSRLKRGEFKQSFELTRNGLVSITPNVPV